MSEVAPKNVSLADDSRGTAGNASLPLCAHLTDTNAHPAYDRFAMTQSWSIWPHHPHLQGLLRPSRLQNPEFSGGELGLFQREN